MTRILATTGLGDFVETTYECPITINDGIIVKNIMTGVCTSDIAMMNGNFGPLPLHMQGHEGLGQVINVGKDVFTDVKVGDYVATRGEPAYADYYPVREGEFVIVPEAHPKYIIEPVACGINVIQGDIGELDGRIMRNDRAKILIIGSGFLAYVAYRTLKLNGIECLVDVVGSSNKDIWNNEGVTLLSEPGVGYEVVVVLKDNHNWLEKSEIINNNALIIDAVGRAVSKQESENLLWKSATTVRPSPRKSLFLCCMEDAVEWIQSGELVVDNFWTKGYNRTTEWPQAFADGANRPAGYSRGYIKWD
jgi:threonine dehydrogenase-like Zn-dependent dehydrogenase